MKALNFASRRRWMRKAALGGASLAIAATTRPVLAALAPPGRLTLIKNARVLTMDPDLGELSSGEVLVKGEHIAAVGSNLPRQDATVIDAQGRILIPGLVDGHWHMWNTLLRNSAPAGAKTFFKSIAAASPRFSPALSGLAVEVACAQALRAGITTINNWAHNIRSPAHAMAEYDAMLRSGLRGRFWYGYPQDMDAEASMDFASIANWHEKMAPLSGRRFDLGIAVRGPERTPPAIWMREWAFARERDLPISTHISISRAMQEKRAILQLAERGLLGPKTQLVHATHADTRDIAAIAQAGSSVCLTPVTEMRAGFGLAPVMAFQRAGINLSLGIDTTVLSGDTNLFSVMQATLNLACAMEENEMALRAQDVLHWATLGSARAMGWDDRIGSITPGKYADMVMLDTTRLDMAPATLAAATVVQSASPDAIAWVMANGAIVKQGSRQEADRKLARQSEVAWRELQAD